MSLPHSNTSSILATISDLSDDGNFSRVWDEVNSLSTPVETLKSQNHEENDWEMVQQTSSPHGVRKKVPHQNRGDIEPPGFVGSINGVSKKNIDGRPPRSDLPTTTNQMDGDMYSMPIHEVLGTSSKDDSDEKVAVKENHIHVPNNSKPEDTEDTTDATTDSSSSATYDSVIEDIRSKVWEEVRQARQKVSLCAFLL